MLRLPWAAPFPPRFSTATPRRVRSCPRTSATRPRVWRRPGGRPSGRWRRAVLEVLTSQNAAFAPSAARQANLEALGPPRDHGGDHRPAGGPVPRARSTPITRRPPRWRRRGRSSASRACAACRCSGCRPRTTTSTRSLHPAPDAGSPAATIHPDHPSTPPKHRQRPEKSRSVHPTTAPTTSEEAATAKNSGVSSATGIVCTSTEADTTGAAADRPAQGRTGGSRPSADR